MEFKENCFIMEKEFRTKDGEAMLHVFIINSFSGNEKKTIGIREKLEHIKNMEYLVFNSEYPGHEGVLAKQICDLFPEEKIRFYACGGSGTFRNILKMIPADRVIELAELPCGLSNDFLNLYGSEREKFEDLENLVYGQAEDLDYLKTTVGAGHNTVSVGFDGTIVKGALILKKLPFFRGMLPYFLVSIVAVLHTDIPELQIIADGEVFEGRFYEIAVGNGNRLGGIFHFGKKAHAKNGKMQLIIVPTKGFWYKIHMMYAAMLNHQELLERRAICRMVKSLEIHSLDGREMIINVDGELEKAKKVRIDICENGMHFVEPKNLDRSKLLWK